MWAQFTSHPLPAHQDHPINRITDKPGMWTKTNYRQTLWGGKFIFYEIHRRRQPCSESILRGVGLFCETILLHKRQQPHSEASPRHIDGFSELHDGRTFFASEGNKSHFSWTSWPLFCQLSSNSDSEVNKSCFSLSSQESPFTALQKFFIFVRFAFITLHFS